MTIKELKRIRELMGRTQVEMAELIGITPNSYARIERGTHRIDRSFERLVRYIYRDHQEGRDVYSEEKG